MALQRVDHKPNTKPPDVIKAVEFYDQYIELDNKLIAELFHCCRGSASKLRRIVEDEMIARNLPRFSDKAVNTETAYEVWHRITPACAGKSNQHQPE